MIRTRVLWGPEGAGYGTHRVGFFAFLAVLAGILIAAGVVDASHAGGFGAEQAWLYVAVLTVGSMISRGLAKASRSPDYEDRA